MTDELKRGLHGRTTLVITHRASLVQAADMVLVLEGGRIVKQDVLDERLECKSLRTPELSDLEHSTVGNFAQ